MFWVPDEDHPPFGRIQIDPILCIGCKKCLSKGPDGCFLDGCPWDAIVMVDIAEVESSWGHVVLRVKFGAEVANHATLGEGVAVPGLTAGVVLSLMAFSVKAACRRIRSGISGELRW
jgi:hypothetical protein